MSLSIGTKGLTIAGLVLLAIGLERLLNSVLVGAHWGDGSPRLFLALSCSGAGIFLLVLAGFSRARHL
jgi:hypothetical protein